APAVRWGTGPGREVGSRTGPRRGRGRGARVLRKERARAGGERKRLATLFCGDEDRELALHLRKGRRLLADGLLGGGPRSPQGRAGRGFVVAHDAQLRLARALVLSRRPQRIEHRRLVAGGRVEVLLRDPEVPGVALGEERTQSIRRTTVYVSVDGDRPQPRPRVERALFGASGGGGSRRELGVDVAHPEPGRVIALRQLIDPSVQRVDLAGDTGGLRALVGDRIRARYAWCDRADHCTSEDDRYHMAQMPRRDLPGELDHVL